MSLGISFSLSNSLSFLLTSFLIMPLRASGLRLATQDFPCSPVVKISPSAAVDMSSIPGQETKSPHVAWCGQKCKKKKQPWEKETLFVTVASAPFWSCLLDWYESQACPVGIEQITPPREGNTLAKSVALKREPDSPKSYELRWIVRQGGSLKVEKGRQWTSLIPVLNPVMESLPHHVCKHLEMICERKLAHCLW